MQERLERVETKVDRVDTKVGGLETRFDRLETRVDHLETRFGDLDTKVDGLATSLVAVESRLSAKIDVQMENMRDVIKKFAEGLGGRLDAIAQQLTESNKKWEAK